MSSADSTPSGPNVDFTKTETVGSTRWMRLETLSYHVPDDAAEGGTSLRKWDRVVRTTKKSEDSIDAVVILAILKHDPNDPLKDEIVAVKQFRPPLDAYTIELPAGLIDPEEDPAQAAKREFKEETGLVGEVISVSPPSFLSPGLTNESACMVRLEVDMTLPENKQNYSKGSENDNLEGCEKDRGLEKLMLPRIGLLEALHGLQQKDGVKIFAALYSMAVGMSVGEGAETPSSKNFPLVNLILDSKEGQFNPTVATCNSVTSALKNSGFLMMKTSSLPLDLQKRALKAAAIFLQSGSAAVVNHPTDPKVYSMLSGTDSINCSSVDKQVLDDLREWYEAVRKARDLLLYCIAVGLGMDENPNFFTRLHDENNDSLRLLKYHPCDENFGNRCKEHSDYGTLTLLLTDGVGGLEAFIDGEWRPVPHEEGTIIVNIGSILSAWTRQELKATLHRVAGPASRGSTTPRDKLLKAAKVPRVSIAYFADPNGDVSTALEDSKMKNVASIGGVSVAQYIQWRSGGTGAERDGVSFTPAEKQRLNKSTK